ncbi:MAG: hypothetical protein GEV13_28445 [Rhodospirillales bacterium]|nr:hypothetical protein [Rhodospirillales bacterium]
MGHVQRTSRRKNLPKAPPAPAFVRWTIPQACVWLRTYDRAKADSLTIEDARLMLMTPDILAPLRCLRAALVGGRFSTRGRPAALELDPPGNRLLNDVDEITPHAFWLAGGDFSIEEEDIAATVYTQGEEQDFHRRWVHLYIDRDEIIGHWQAPHMVLGDGPRELAYLTSEGYLRANHEDNPSWFLGRDDVTVKGFDANGNRVTIDREALTMLRPVIEGDSLTLGSARWSGVVVSLTNLPPVTEPSHDDGHGAEAIEEPQAAQPFSDANYPAEELSAEAIAKAVAPSIKRIAAADLQLTAAQFRTVVLGKYGLSVLVKTIEAAWALAAHERWRKQGGGTIIDERRVTDLRRYFPKDFFPKDFETPETG